ncbi:MAG: hypothetical protein FD161_3201 [Limisphaerales bacterium]|nr:MAG: hypothetical protein FD161_3201 [Limisphaerales bacterium]KAG0507993.1 MAG: hypothetical protein E1N63_2867 [Limisphaerales bacterium]TXT48099.1 MAG: hypothetical protein FD140_3762 [Limisphaerales bacterium]
MINVFGKDIPIAVFTALVGAIGTLVGGIVAGGIALLLNRISNRQQNERLKQQLSHDAEQKGIERRHKAKAEIFLLAAEELAKGARYLIRYHEASLSPADHASIISGYDAALAKVHLVGDFETIRTLTEANECFQIEALRLNKLRTPLQRKAAQLKMIEAQLKEDLQSRKSVEGRFEQIYRVNPTDPEVPQLTQQFKCLHERISKSQEQRAIMERELYEGSLQLFRECRTAVRAYSDKLRQLNLVARDELALPLGPAAPRYLDMMQRTNDRMDSEMKALVEDLLASNRPLPQAKQKT